MTLVCQNTLRQTGCSVPQDVVYAFALSFGRVCHSRVKFFVTSASGKAEPDFFTVSSTVEQNLAAKQCNAAQIGFVPSTYEKQAAQHC